MRILVIDDDRKNLEIISKMLNKEDMGLVIEKAVEKQ